MNRRDTKLEIKFERDLKQILLAQLKNAGYPFNTKTSTEKILRQYFDVRFREISSNPRKVHISKKLENHLPKGDLKVAFDEIVARASAGGGLNHYLSMELFNPNYKDLLLYDWGIHHLHLGIASDKGDPRFIARTAELLYVRVEEGAFYFIDILNHDPIDGFSNQKLIQIIHDNWPDLIKSSRAIGIQRHSLTNEMGHNVRQAHATTAVSVSDGTTYFPAGGGYASDGSSIRVTIGTDILLEKLYALEQAIKNDIQCPIPHLQSCRKMSQNDQDETGELG